MYIDFCGLRFSGLTVPDILTKSQREFVHVVTVGAEFIIEANANERLRGIINRNTSTFDGQLPYLLARAGHPSKSFDKISGADFIYDVCSFAKKYDKRIFLLGGYPESNKKSMNRMRRIGISADGHVTGVIPYPFPEERNEEILSLIRKFQPHFIFVALGMPKQEYWIDENREELARIGVEMAIGCGGTLEVFSHVLPRAPRWMQLICLEGLFRLLKDPTPARFKRLFSTVRFLQYIFKS